jgi:aldehyde dehydrogenase (NAD+)
VSNHDRVEKVRDTFRTKRTRPYEWRVAQLQALKRFLTEKNQEIQAALWKDLRKGTFESEVTEQGVVLGEIDFTLKHLAGWMKPESAWTPLLDQPGCSEIRHDPYGVVLIIGAWNYPINLLLAPLVGALAGGNAAVLKPSELAPATSAMIAQWIPEYLDREAVIVVEGGVPETDDLLNCVFDYIFFTGSGPVGKIVMRKAAENLTPVTLELGGKSPALVMDDASIKVAARRIVWGKFMNAGQTCIAPDYVLIHPSVEAEFLAEVKISLEAFYGKDAKQSKDYCRIVNDRNFQRLEKFLGNGEVYCGGATDAKERYIEPTVLRIKSLDTVNVPVMLEEIFGPILPVIQVPDLDHAIDFINARAKPLALYLFSKSSTVKERVLSETSSGGVCINDVVMHMPSPYIPFGGVGPSGMGHYHGKRSFDTFTHAKGIMKKTTWPDFPIRYAPYNPSKLNWIKRLS